MLEAEQITYALSDGTSIIENASISLASNEVVGLTGESGIGKTTFAKVLSGFLKPQKGNISIKQTFNNPHPVQLIWQHPEQAVNPKWRIKKILEEAGSIDWQLLDELRINTSWLYRFPHQLSGGELQRVCIARCLITKPQFIVADEITTMLDPIAQAEIWQLLLTFVQKHRIGLLAISHDKAILQRISDRTLPFHAISN